MPTTSLDPAAILHLEREAQVPLYAKRDISLVRLTGGRVRIGKRR